MRKTLLKMALAPCLASGSSLALAAGLCLVAMPAGVSPAAPLAGGGAVTAGVAAAAAAAAGAVCPAARPRIVVERFMSADCESCWQQAMPSTGAAPFVLDWIVPSARGADAPLALAAVPESAGRAARAGTLPSDAALRHDTPLPARRPLRVSVLDGPAMNGYIGLQMTVRQSAGPPAAAGLAGYIALVERIAAGAEGNATPRQLVRTLIGPFPLLGLAAGHPATELRATGFPENAKPERLTAVGWVETAEGRIIATASAPFAGCGLPR